MANKHDLNLGANEEIEKLLSSKKRSLFREKNNDKGSCGLNTRIYRETITIIWYDNQVNKHECTYTDAIKQTQTMLHRLNYTVHLCSNEIDCIAQMENSKNERVLLITSGTCATETLLEKAHSLRHVDTILIFCMNASKYESSIRDIKNTKVKGIFTNQDSLKQYTVKTIREIEKHIAVFALYDRRKLKSIHSLDRECGSFVWRQLLKEVIKKIPRNNDSEEFISKREMLQQCREYYRDNETHMKAIDNFDQCYTHNEAIWWYTRDCFLSRLVNKALLTDDIDALNTYGFYIADLCTCIAEQSKRLREKSDRTFFEVYRGKKQSHAEIQRLKDNIGQLISAKGFLSTSWNREVAEMFAGIETHPLAILDCEAVIYEILVDLRQSDIVLADIESQSHFEDEEEVLFDLASVFKIESMTFDNDTKVWICRMTASNEGATIAKEYIEKKRASINDDNILILLGDLFFDMGEFTKSKLYFENLNNRIPHNANVLFGLGRACFALHTEYDRALEHFNMALRICTSQNPPDIGISAQINNYIGRTYRHQCKYAEALHVLAKASDQYKQVSMSNHVCYAEMLSARGFVQYQLGADELAFQDFQQALYIIQEEQPFDNPALSSAHMNMSLPLYHMGQYDKALEFVESAFNIATHVLPSKSLQIGLILNYIGKYLYKKGDYEQALTKHLKSQEIYQYFYPEEKSPYFAVRYNNIGKVYYRLKKYSEASEQYSKAFAILQSLKYDHINAAYTWKNKGEVCLVLEDYDQSIKCFYRAIEIYGRIFSNTQHRDEGKCIHLLGRVHHKRGNYQEALCKYREAYQIWKKTLVKQHPDLSICLKDIAILLWQLVARKMRVKVQSLSCFLFLQLRKPTYGLELSLV
ncbi:hypothetical protein I4U23_003595 [Adineta vaga]|nr:hypothetical protein I4U23_003595 [Adineta vaga]